MANNFPSKNIANFVYNKSLESYTGKEIPESRKEQILSELQEYSKIRLERYFTVLGYRGVNNGQKSFQISNQGEFLPEIAKGLVKRLPVLEQEAQNFLSSLHSELINFLKENQISEEWGKTEIQENSIYLNLKSQKPIKKDPNFVKAEMTEICPKITTK